MKKIIGLFLCFGLFFMHVVPIHAQDFIQIKTKEDLNNIRNNSSASYRLMNDIVFEESDFLEDGDFYNNGKGWNPITNFYGTLDGNGYVIKGLQMKDSGFYNNGFINKNQGTIKNLGFEDVNFDVSYTGYAESSYNAYDSLGVIAGTNSGVIQSCYVSGIVDGNVEALGGIAGINSGTIRDSYNAAIILGGSTIFEIQVGGITGYNTNRIESCFNLGDISTDAPQHFQWVGGIAGENSGTITKSYNQGKVAGEDYTAGIVSLNKGSITSTYNEGHVWGELFVGGIVSYNYGGTIQYCYNTGYIETPLQCAAGISARNYENGRIYNCFNTGTIHGKGPGRTNCYAGGIVGDQGKGSIQTCYNVGNIVLDYSGSLCYGGTIIAYLYGGSVSDCYGLQNSLHGLYDGYREGTMTNVTTLTYDQMKKQENYTNFNFSTIWKLEYFDGYIFPYLQSIPMHHTDYSISYATHPKMMKVGTTYTLETIFSKQAFSNYVRFVTSDNSIATVDQNGTVTAKGVGNVYITAIAANDDILTTTIQVVSASSTYPTLDVTSESNTRRGQILNVYIYSYYNPRMTNYDMDLEIDQDFFELVEVIKRNNWGNSYHSNQIIDNKLHLKWKNDKSYGNTGNIVSIKLRVKNNAPLTQTSINIINHLDNDVYFFTNNKTIQIMDCLIGDVDGNGIANSSDRTILTRYLAEWSGYTLESINLLGSDVNQDGKINTLDRVILARYIAKWSGYTTLPYKG